MNSKYEWATDRSHNLINEGKHVAELERPSGDFSCIPDRIPLHAWLVSREAG
jgi:hypothetical protein